MRISYLLYILPPLVAGIGNVLLGSAVFLKNPRGRLNRIWAIYCTCTAIWSLGFFMVYINSGNKEAALFWNKFYSIGMVLIPTVYLHYVLELTEAKRRWLWSICWFSYALAFGIIATIPTQLFNSGMVLYEWGYSPIRNITGRIYDVTFPFLVITGWLVLFTSLRNATGKRRVQIKYGMAAAIIGFLFGLTNFLPLYGIAVYPIGHIGSFVASALIVYSIVRYTFMDIEVVIKKSIVYSMVTALIAASYVGFIILGQRMMNSYQLHTGWSMGLTLLAVSFIALVFEPVRIGIQSLVDRMFFKTRYDYQEAIKKFSRMVVTILDLDVLLHKTVETIEKTLMVREVVIFLKEPGSGDYTIHAFAGADETKLDSWKYKSVDGLIRKLKTRPNKVGEEYDAMIDGRLVVSLDIEKDLTGFVVLGDKKSGDVFTPGDFELLNTFADQLSIAVENAWLYRAAITDRLTKVFSGTYFYDRLEEEVARSSEQDGRLAVLLFDVDGFSDFGKERGAGVSNRALSMIGEAIKQGNRAFDVPARIGDDEFALIMPGADRDNAAFTAGIIAKRIRDIRIDGESGLLGITSGMAYTEKGDKSARRLMNDARLDLIRNKLHSKDAESRTAQRPS